jgi:hypothetical protein
VQFVVIPANGKPRVYDGEVTSGGVGNREGYKIATGAGEVEVSGLRPPQLHTDLGTVQMKFNNDARLFRDIGVAQPSIAPTPR